MKSVAVFGHHTTCVCVFSPALGFVTVLVEHTPSVTCDTLVTVAEATETCWQITINDKSYFIDVRLLVCYVSGELRSFAPSFLILYRGIF
jgi:hypothetical protein